MGPDSSQIGSVQPNPLQPRRMFDEDTLKGLTDSVRELGVLQPVLVRAKDDGYELIAGERRWRAAKRDAACRPSLR